MFLNPQFRYPPLRNMKIEGTHEVRAKRERVYQALVDPEVLKRCIPGCERLERTAENTFQRFDVDNSEELAGGFPKTREELFRYRGIILGSVDASLCIRSPSSRCREERDGGIMRNSPSQT